MMDHKAFVFDWVAFDHELRPTLENALSADDQSRLTSFIECHITSLKDPYEGEPLAPDWKRRLSSSRDAHELGDFALTKYYNPKADVGLGEQWGLIHDSIERELGVPDLATLGSTIGPPGNRFDAGKMGSYFQTPEDTRRNMDLIETIRNPSAHGLVDLVARMLGGAITANRGLYITF